MKLYLLLLLFTFSLTHANTIDLTLSGAQKTSMPLTILILDNTNEELVKVAKTIQNDLHFTNQFTIKAENVAPHITKKELFKHIKELCHTGTPLTLCLNTQNAKTLEWRLYDTMQATMLKGKKYKKQGTVVRGWGHAIADDIIKTLTGNDGFFSTRISYCKETTIDNKKVRHIYIADFDGTNEELLVANDTITVAPRWNTDKHNPKIFYSEYTDTNVRLMSVDMKKNNTTASDFDGVNMLAGFSPDGKAVAYSASKGNGHCQLYYHTKGNIQSFTRNSGNNFSPIFIDNEHICFGSDAQTKLPQIYIGNITTGHVQRITTGGYCTSPNYCKATNSISYHKKINNTMQICIYNCAKKTHTQITTGPDNKHEGCLSLCGNYLLFGQETKGKSRLVSLHIPSNTTKYLTSAHENCSYPHWSPQYKQFPVTV